MTRPGAGSSPRPDAGTAAGSSDRVSEWDAYWNAPRLAACLRDEKGNYGGVIADCWQRWFGWLPRRTRLLDVATGNGAVALMALEHSDRNRLDWEVTGTDAAHIDPPSALPHLAGLLKRIRFVGETPAEALPFDDDRFHALTGQYAIEYTDMPRTLAEAARVLKPDGHLMFITHRRDSSVCRETERQLRLVQTLMELRLSHDVGELLKAPEDTEASRSARRQFDEGAGKAVRLLRQSDGQGRTFVTQYLQQLGELYQARQHSGTDAALQAVARLERDVRSHRDRLKALRGAALTREGVRRTQALIRRCGFRRVRTRRIREHGAQRPLGQCFHGVREVREA